MKRYILSALAGGTLMLGTAFAQAPSPGSTQAEGEHHAARVENQKDRIKDGVEDGQLTKKQARRLGREEGAINAEARRMKAKNGGQLTERQEKRIHRQMNRESRRIARAKH
jgi:hypothetical protein